MRRGRTPFLDHRQAGAGGGHGHPGAGTAAGGTGILSETPEIYGVEHTLTRRAASRAIGEKIERIRWWKEEYSVGRDVQINGKVRPGLRVRGHTGL